MLIFFSVHILHAQEKAWKCVKNSKGISVFSKKSESTGIKIIKIDTRVKASLSSLVAVVKDAPNHKNWVFLNKFAKIIQSDSPFKWVYYGETDAPWPVSDRDIVVVGSLYQDTVTNAVRINARAIPDLIALNEGEVRIPFAVSQWSFVPEDSGFVNVEFKVEINFGGNIPKWLMNLTATKGPYESIRHFVKQLSKEKYRNIHLSYIREAINKYNTKVQKNQSVHAGDLKYHKTKPK